MKSISTNTDDSQISKQHWPFGHHSICKVMEVQMPEFHEPGDFQIVANNDVSDVFLYYVHHMRTW